MIVLRVEGFPHGSSKFLGIEPPGRVSSVKAGHKQLTRLGRLALLENVQCLVRPHLSRMSLPSMKLHGRCSLPDIIDYAK